MYLAHFVMDFLVRIIIFLFLVHAALTVKQDRDINAVAVNSDNTKDHAVGIRRKRSWVKDVIDATTGTRKVVKVARIWWRVQQVKRILMQDTTLQRIESTVKVYTKRGNFKRAEKELFHMSLYGKKHTKTSSGDMAEVGNIGEYIVRFRKHNPACRPIPCTTIEMWKPPSHHARRNVVVVIYDEHNKFNGVHFDFD